MNRTKKKGSFSSTVGHHDDTDPHHVDVGRGVNQSEHNMRRRRSRRETGSKKTSIVTVSIAIMLVCLVSVHLYVNNAFRRGEGPSESIHSTNTKSPSSSPHHHPAKISTSIIMKFRRFNNEMIWDSLVKEGEALQKESLHDEIHAMEVGMYDSRQCIMAAESSMHVHYIEPSPTSSKESEKASIISLKVSGKRSTSIKWQQVQ